jgi:hypothetical protein
MGDGSFGFLSTLSNGSLYDGVANFYTIRAWFIMGGWCFDGVESMYDCTDVFVAGAGTVDS